MRVWRMRTGISFTVSPTQHRRLAALIGDRNTPQKHVWRAEIILFSAAGLGTVEIMRRTGKSKTCVWRWQERFAEDGVEGLLRDKTRPSRIPPLGPEVTGRVAALTLQDPPGETTHWTADMMAKTSGISAGSLSCRTIRISSPNCVMSSVSMSIRRAHAVVLSVDEKSQIQALNTK